MKKWKLFPKTFFYVFSLMSAISFISHALFYFMMPIVYTSQKEAKFLDTQERLIEILKNTPPDKMERTVSRYAIQYQMGIFVNCDGAAYNLMADSASPSKGDSALQETVESHWSVPSNSQDADLSYLQEDFYVKTNSQFYSGAHFETADGKPSGFVSDTSAGQRSKRGGHSFFAAYAAFVFAIGGNFCPAVLKSNSGAAFRNLRNDSSYESP